VRLARTLAFVKAAVANTPDKLDETLKLKSSVMAASLLLRRSLNGHAQSSASANFAIKLAMCRPSKIDLDTVE
jgi:hypothetical protein